MTLRDLLASDVEEVVLNTSDFAEQVTYFRKDSPGSPRTINALVQRVEPDDREESSHMTFRSASVWIANDDTLGVVTPKEGDKIRLIMRAGQDPVTARVTGIGLTNDGAHRLEVTA